MHTWDVGCAYRIIESSPALDHARQSDGIVLAEELVAVGPSQVGADQRHVLARLRQCDGEIRCQYCLSLSSWTRDQQGLGISLSGGAKYPGAQVLIRVSRSGLGTSHRDKSAARIAPPLSYGRYDSEHGTAANILELVRGTQPIVEAIPDKCRADGDHQPNDRRDHHIDNVIRA
jgi:hypothetical protein